MSVKLPFLCTMSKQNPVLEDPFSLNKE